MKKIGVTLVASLASLSTGLMTAHAAVQSQTQCINVKQGQSISATQGSTVNETNSMNVSTNQSQSQPQGTSSPLVNANQHEAQNTQNTSSTNYGGGTSSQAQGVTFYNKQQQTGPGPITPSGTSSTNIGNSAMINSGGNGSTNSHHGGDGGSTTTTLPSITMGSAITSTNNTLTQELSFANSLSNGAFASSISNGPVQGYAVFDIQGNEISDNQGASGNAKGHFDQFAPNQPVVLILRPVGSNGLPVRNGIRVNVNLKSTNSSSQMTVDGHTFDGLIINAGSYGVPFVYTNTGSTASFDVIDQFFQKDKNNSDTKTSATPPSSDSSQGTSVDAKQCQDASSSSAINATENQSTRSMSQQSQDSVSQDSSDSTAQTQTIQTDVGSTIHQQQGVDAQNYSAESSSTSTDDTGTLHIQLGQSQSIQPDPGTTTSTNTATENETATFGATGSMEIRFSQSQQSTTGDALQSQGIGISASDPNGALSGGGNLSVYLNGNLSGSYSGVTGNVSASQSQTTDTSGDSSDNQESNTVTYQQGGKTVTVQIG